jgi:UPF0755 protein
VSEIIYTNGTLRTLFILVLIVALAAGAWFSWAVTTPVLPAVPTVVWLHPGLSTRAIANQLKAAGVIRSEDAFLLWHLLYRGRRLKAGEYEFERAASISDIHKRLVRGDVLMHTLVVPEGYTIFDIAAAVEAAGLGSRDEFLKVAQSEVALIEDFAPQATSLEGYLFPDTYEFTKMQGPHEIAAVMVRHFRQVAESIGLSGNVHTQVTMASIVEKETAAPEERAKVASVYYNRLKRNMALDADPSVIYAKLLAGTYTGALHHEDLFTKSPYNTYRNPGMPPGPIANPGRSALEAAMHPEQTDYLYFVSDGNGHHRFARNIEEQNRNINAYHRTLKAQR